MEKFGLPKSWLDRDDGATNSNLIYNGFPNHHGPAEAWQVGMLYNRVYNRDCMIHDIVCERSEEHTSELQSLMRMSYAVFCLMTQSLWHSLPIWVISSTTSPMAKRLVTGRLRKS